MKGLTVDAAITPCVTEYGAWHQIIEQAPSDDQLSPNQKCQHGVSQYMAHINGKRRVPGLRYTCVLLRRRSMLQ